MSETVPHNAELLVSRTSAARNPRIKGLRRRSEPASVSASLQASGLVNAVGTVAGDDRSTVSDTVITRTSTDTGSNAGSIFGGNMNARGNTDASADVSTDTSANTHASTHADFDSTVNTVSKSRRTGTGFLSTIIGQTRRLRRSQLYRRPAKPPPLPSPPTTRNANGSDTIPHSNAASALNIANERKQDYNSDNGVERNTECNRYIMSRPSSSRSVLSQATIQYRQELRARRQRHRQSMIELSSAKSSSLSSLYGIPPESDIAGNANGKSSSFTAHNDDDDDDHDRKLPASPSHKSSTMPLPPTLPHRPHKHRQPQHVQRQERVPQPNLPRPTRRQSCVYRPQGNGENFSLEDKILQSTHDTDRLQQVMFDIDHGKSRTALVFKRRRNSMIT